jgi:aromatic-L-amino-acid/L-tryptophan decarboxylase
MLAAGLNANPGGRDHMPTEVERQIVRWMQTIFGFPESATGLFVTGTSMANLAGVLIARDAALGFEVRSAGVAASPRRLTAYASAAVHSCIARAMGFSGLGSDALRLIPAGPGRGMELADLETAAGLRRSCWSAPPAPSIPARLTIFALSAIVRTARIFGSMSMERLEHSRCWLTILLPW